MQKFLVDCPKVSHLISSYPSSGYSDSRRFSEAAEAASVPADGKGRSEDENDNTRKSPFEL